MKLSKQLSLAVWLFFSFSVLSLQNFAQSVGISSVSITADASSIMELRTTTKGLLIPRMTTGERDAIASAATGLIVYNTSINNFNFYNGSSWVVLSSGSGFVNSVSGTANRISIGGTASDPVIDISSGYIGQASISTLGTIGTGTWNGSTIGTGYGGTGTSTAFTPGSLVFAGTSGVYDQNNTNLFWNNTNNRLGIGTASPNTTLQVGAIGTGTDNIFIGGTASSGYMLNTQGAGDIGTFYSEGTNIVGIGFTPTTTIPSRSVFKVTKTGAATFGTSVATDDNIIIQPYTGGTNSFAGTMTSADLTSTRTYTLPNASGTVALVGGAGVGTVTNVSVVNANGFSGTVANATTTPAITLNTTVSGMLKGDGSAISAAAVGTDYSAGTSALGTGILKSTTGTGALSIAVAGDFPTLNQNTTGSAATLTTSRSIHGGSFNGSADVTNIIASTYGGTGNGFTKFSGPATSEKTFTLPNASATILTDNATVTAAQGGTGIASYTTGDLLYASAATTLGKLSAVATGNALISGGVSTAPSWGKIGLTSHVSGVLPIANGGTNSSTALNNNRIMVSASGSIVEAAALTNGQLLIGSTGAAPVAANITAGNGIVITNAAGSITIANEPTIIQTTGTSTLTTTSTTDVAMSTPLKITAPATGDYLIYLTAVVSNSNSGKEVILSLYVNSTKITVAETESTAAGGDRNTASFTYLATGVTSGQEIEIRWRAETNTATITKRILIAQRVK